MAYGKSMPMVPKIHPAVISYLDIHKDNFYRMETSVDGRMFATARGWEDLSQFLYAYEKLGKRADREVVGQYIQHGKAARDFANYLELFEKYKTDYRSIRYWQATLKTLRWIS